MIWTRNLWGVELKGGMKENQPMILGAAWNGPSPHRYEGEPTRALLFCTREQAREWCRNRRERSKDLGWTFTPVKVRELVEKVPNSELRGRALFARSRSDDLLGTALERKRDG